MGLIKYPASGIQINEDMQIYSRYVRDVSSIEKIAFSPSFTIEQIYGVATAGNKYPFVFGSRWNGLGIDGYKVQNSQIATLQGGNPQGPWGILAGGGVISTGNLVFYAGGWSSSGVTNSITCYEVVDDVVKHVGAEPLRASRAELAGASWGNFVLFAGGRDNQGTLFKTIDVYDTNARHSELNLSTARYGITGVTCGNKVFFAGGMSANGISKAIDVFQYISDEWVSLDPLSLSEERFGVAGAACGNYVFLAGGEKANGTHSHTVDVYDIRTMQLVQGVHPLSVARGYAAGVACGNYVFFAGDQGEYGVSGAVDVYKVNGNNISKISGITPLAIPRKNIKATAAEHLVLFFGGEIGAGNYTLSTDAYRINELVQRVGE